QCNSKTVKTLAPVPFPSYMSIAIGSDGMPILVSYTGDLFLTHCENAECNSQFLAGGRIDTGRGQYPSVTIGTDGLPIISYYDGPAQNLKVAHCSDPDCQASTKTT